MSAIVLALIVLLGIYRPDLPIVLDSDTLYLDDLWLSLTQGNGLSHWFLPPSPAFFPDLPVVGFLHLVPNLAMRHALFGLAQLLLLTFSMVWLARQRLALEWGRALSLSLAGGLLLGQALILAPAHQGLLKPGFHGGALLASLWLFALSPDGQGSAGLMKKLCACALAALMTLSDRLFLVWGVVPVVLSQASSWRASSSDEWKGWCAWLAGGLVLGEAWIASLHGPGLPLIMAAEPLKFWQPMPTLLSAQLRQFSELCKGAGPAALVSSAWLAWHGKSLLSARQGVGRDALDPLSRFVLMSAACGVLAGIGLGGDLSRYSYPFFLLPLLVLPFDLPQIWAERLPLVGACLLLPYGFMVDWRQRMIEPWPQAYPAAALMLDKALKEDARLSLGMAHYGQARRLRMLAKIQPNLLPIKAEPGSAELQTYDWMVDASIFKPLELKKADYILMDGLDAELVAGAFGRPKRVVKDGVHELWVYR